MYVARTRTLARFNEMLVSFSIVCFKMGLSAWSGCVGVCYLSLYLDIDLGDGGPW